jgi:phospholipase/carboxylesterase
MSETDPGAQAAFLAALGRLGPALLQSLDALERARRRLHPPELPALREAIAPLRPRLETALADLGEVRVPPGLEDLRSELVRSGSSAARALALFVDPGSPATAVARVLGAMHEHCRAQALLFPLRKALPPVSRFFLEEPFHSRLAELDPDVVPEGIRVGLHRAGEEGSRGGFCLYVPESYDGSEAWPLVVALHGGSGDGADFLWSWLVEARGRRFLLLSPTARGSTWSLDAPELDAIALRSMVAYVAENWRVDAGRVLLTGLSDGATFTFLCGLRDDMPFTALAPVSGVLHPMNFANGNLARARGRRIYLVHGALDWMFPVQIARMAHEELVRVGADVTFREIADLSHTYPREENDRILAWLDPRLALPVASC